MKHSAAGVTDGAPLALFAQIGGAFFQVTSQLTIILSIPVVEAILSRCSSHLKSALARWVQRSVAGLLAGATAAVVAGSLELVRRAAPLTGVSSMCAPEGVQMSAMSGWWIVLPSALMGVSEGLVAPAVLEFTYEQAPLSMRNSLQGFQLLAVGALSSVYVTTMIHTGNAVGLWTNDLNKGGLEWVYLYSAMFALAALPLLYVINRAWLEKERESAGPQNKGCEGEGDRHAGETVDIRPPSSPSAQKKGHSSSKAQQDGGSGGFGAMAGDKVKACAPPPT